MFNNGTMKLFMIKIGATPKGRLIEQHDVFFGIAAQVQDLVPQFEAAWPEAADNWHIDCWREISHVAGHAVRVVPRAHACPNGNTLFFINLGGYKRGDFEEHHHKMLLVASDSMHAIAQAKASDFYRDFHFDGAVSHIDDKYGVDVDDIHNIRDVLPRQDTAHYAVQIDADAHGQEDRLHIGYLSRKKFTLPFKQG